MFTETLPPIQGVLTERIIYLFVGLIWSSVAWVVASRYSFFKLPKETFPKAPKEFMWYLIGAFCIYFAVALFVVPALALIGMNTFQLSMQIEWFNILTMLLSSLGILLYLFIIPNTCSRVIWGKKEPESFLFGVMTWFISYPFVIIISQVIGIAILILFRQKHVDQIAVQYLREVLKHPALFWTTTVAMVTAVPVVEEILFRGFLQTWLRQIFSRKGAIASSSFIFALLHYSVFQGIDNIELLTSLFVLSCFLGFIYERQLTLWAPIGLHVFFNSMGVVFVYLQQYIEA